MQYTVTVFLFKVFLAVQKMNMIKIFFLLNRPFTPSTICYCQKLLKIFSVVCSGRTVPSSCFVTQAILPDLHPNPNPNTVQRAGEAANVL